MKPSVAIIYLSYHCEPFVEQAVDSLAKSTYPKDRLAFVVVDNPHPVHGGSGGYIRERILPRAGKDLPAVELIENQQNVGFAQGNNKGLQWAAQKGYDYVIFQNSDAYFGPQMIEKMIEAMEADERIAIAQPLIMLHPDRHLVNSSGNVMHILGMGYCRDYRRAGSDLTLSSVSDVPYASGAVWMMRSKQAVKLGGWDKDFFMYHEDTEWSLRCRVMKKRVVLVREARAFHQYEFSRSMAKYYFMERNRYSVLLMYYRWPTLLLLLPALMGAEIGLFFISLTRGWWREKLKVYAYWVRPAHVKLWLKKRAAIQKMRLIGDRDLLQYVTGRIEFQESATQSPLVTYVANPALSAYTFLLKMVIFW